MNKLKQRLELFKQVRAKYNTVLLQTKSEVRRKKYQGWATEINRRILLLEEKIIKNLHK